MNHLSIAQGPVIAASSAGTCGAHKGARLVAMATLNATTIQANAAMLGGGAASAFCKEISLHAAKPRDRVRVGFVIWKVTPAPAAGTRTGAKEAASRVFNVERIAASAASL